MGLVNSRKVGGAGGEVVVCVLHIVYIVLHIVYCIPCIRIRIIRIRYVFRLLLKLQKSIIYHITDNVVIGD